MTGILCTACGAANSESASLCAACGEDLPSVSPGDWTPVEGAAWPGLSATAADPLVGSRVSHFRVTGLLGRGGMGVVYRAMDLDLGREVALKFLPPQAVRPIDEARFRREAQAAASLDHPNIGTVHEIGEHNGRRFLAMALYEGETLAQRLERAAGEPLPVPEVASIAAQVASALDAAHGAGIVHRDLKPSNLMLTRNRRVKLLDFGLARQMGSPTLTQEGFLVGTVAYMAPEQLSGEVSDQRADVWALGVVLYEMLTSGRPFDRGNKGLVHAILHENPPPLRQARPEIPPALAAIVERCLEKYPSRRPSGGEILAELRAAGLVTGEPGSSGATAPVVPARPRALRRWGTVLAATILLLGGVASFQLTQPAEPAASDLVVAVLAPEVGGTANATQRELVSINLQATALRTLTAVKGLSPVDSWQWVNANGPATAVAVAKVTAAQEVLATHAHCAPDLCRVDLRRLAGDDGRVLWAKTLQISTSDLREAAEALATHLLQAYPSHARRSSSLDLNVDEADYGRYLGLRRWHHTVQPAELTEEMLDEMEALRVRYPRFLEAYYLEAQAARQLYQRTDDTRYRDRELRVTREARKLAPDDPRFLRNLVAVHIGARRLDEAEEELVRLEVLAPQSAGLLWLKGRLAELRGDMNEARVFMRQAVEHQPSVFYLGQAGRLEFQLGRLDAARRYYEELLARVPDHSEGLWLLAWYELRHGDPERAIGALGRLVLKSPDNPRPHAELGTTLMVLRRYTEAETALRQALALSPDDPVATLNLADSLLLLGRLGEARDLYLQLVAHVDATASPSFRLLSAQAQALAHLGENRRAVAVIQRALREAPGAIDFSASLVYILVDDRNSALLHAARALENEIEPFWFRLPWFDPLQRDPTFAALVERTEESAGGQNRVDPWSRR